ncbi:MAG: RNA polymerase sigma factor [Acidimicrobiia bacterium]
MSKPLDELTSLVCAAQRGDRLALAAAIRSTQAEMQSFAAALVAPEVAEDVAQEIWLRAWRALPSFRGDASARTWLFAIARRTCADHVRARTRFRRLADRLSYQGVDGFITVDEAATLQDLVASLQPERREAFMLTQVHGFTYEEVAGMCGVPIGTVRSRVARARGDLVAMLAAASSV